MLDKVAPEQGGAADSEDEGDIQERFHQGLLLQGHGDTVCFACGLRRPGPGPPSHRATG